MKRNRRHRKIRTGRVVAIVVICAVLVTGGLFVTKYVPYAKAYVSLLQSDDPYKDDLFNLLRDNPETAQFVLDYEEKKDLPPAETIGEVSFDSVPLFLQWDERWGYHIYGGNLLAVTGCGPSCLSMVAVYLTQNVTLTPAFRAWCLCTHGDEKVYRAFSPQL